MDPYIEKPAIWPDFHNRLADEISARLNQVIQPRYFARLTPYLVYERIDIQQVYSVRPDVGVLHERRTEGLTSAATTLAPAPVESRIALEDALTLHAVE